MRDKLSDILSQPYPSIDRQYLWPLIISISGGIILFLAVFKPFGLQYIIKDLGYVMVLGYGAATFLTLTFFLKVIPNIPFFSSYFTDDRWKVWKHIVWELVLIAFIGIFNLLYTAILVGDYSLQLRDWLFFELYTLAIAVIPVGFITLWRYNQLLKSHLRSATDIDSKTNVQEASQEPQSVTISFQGQNKGEVLTVKGEALRYICSEGNYVRVVYYKRGTLENELLRSTLKNIEQQLKSEKYLIRCHRSYIVNVIHISHADGNAQGLQLQLYDCNEYVPVSRTYIETIRDAIDQQF
ncbi:LytR/AlgR family response regulator transcription factor [Fodinibius halophilus]|uniref:LytTR family transcriptional regulator n=1 Tax=Fodinibius halophilus TaxID=1736908 RepID=A0A6M1SZA3_9BACT|nr:LytTR family DNA-binding domain-containing protein [Fodinibius halophilus]NGP86987.1 LytTR family transcriptional regulator [Fodinibius halophilus]